jgi:hypothetical protein
MLRVEILSYFHICPFLWLAFWGGWPSLVSWTPWILEFYPNSSSRDNSHDHHTLLFFCGDGGLTSFFAQAGLEPWYSWSQCPYSLGWQARATMPSYWLRWGLMNISQAGLIVPPKLNLLSSKDYRHEPPVLACGVPFRLLSLKSRWSRVLQDGAFDILPRDWKRNQASCNLTYCSKFFVLNYFMTLWALSLTPWSFFNYISKQRFHWNGLK